MKTCECCGAQCAPEAPHCPACGECTWAPIAPAAEPLADTDPAPAPDAIPPANVSRRPRGNR